MSGPPEGAWARGRGVTLVALAPGEPLTPGIQQALRDGLERGYEGDTPTLPADARAYRIEVRGETVGVLAVRTAWPAPSEATIIAAAIDHAHRGRSAAMRALLLAEQALAEEGYVRTYAIVPRTNGRGLYFMLRCGYAPVLGTQPPEPSLDVTWFARRNGRDEARGA